MLICCCWNAVSGISSAVQAIVTVALFVIAWKEGKKAYQKWETERIVKRSEFLADLIDKFEKDNIQSMVSLAGDSTDAQKWLEEVLNNRQKEVEAQSSFRFFSYLCYLMDNKLITENESGLFENALKGILSNEQVQEYFRIAMNDNGVVIPYKNLQDYAVRNHIYIYAANDSSDSSGGIAQGTTESPTERKIIETNKGKPPLTAQELSQYPVAVIRINRLYRPDMKSNELYDTTRGWWRVNLGMANRTKYALSVAEDEVKEMYAITGWHKYGTAEDAVVVGADGRYQFDGEVVKDEAIRQLYVGRSIDGLFKQGDAYPVRYFGIKS